jgi:hypothetical protein
MSTTTTRQYQDTRVDVRLVLTALWTAMLFVFAYVDIVGFYRASSFSRWSTSCCRR